MWRDRGCGFGFCPGSSSSSSSSSSSGGGGGGGGCCFGAGIGLLALFFDGVSFGQLVIDPGGVLADVVVVGHVGWAAWKSPFSMQDWQIS